MPDLESRMPDLLRRAAGEPQRDPELERRVIRRARRRRVVNASVAGVAAVALVAGIVVGVRAFTPVARQTPADPTPDVETSLQAVWPETTGEALAAAQAQADAGALDWRLDPVQTAVRFAIEIFDWDPADVEAAPADGAGRVVISNRGLASPLLEPPQPAPETVLTLERLGIQGESGVWSVTAAASRHIDIDMPFGGEELRAGLVDTIAEWMPGLWLIVDGRVHGTVTLDLLPPGGATPGHTFPVTLPAQVAPTGTTIGILVALWDPEGTIVTGEAFPYVVPAGGTDTPGATGATGASGASGPAGVTGPILDAPAAVVETRDAVLEAASKLDFDALEALIDPDRFAYNFDDVSNPVPIWREDPTLLEPLVAILQMPSTTNREAYPDVDPSSPTVHIWPALMGSDLRDLTAEDREMLDILGITDRDVRDMIGAFGGYVGPRAGIDEDGTWIFYVIGGD